LFLLHLFGLIVMLSSCKNRETKNTPVVFSRSGDTLFPKGRAMIFFLPPDSVRLKHLDHEFKSGRLPYWQEFEAEARNVMSSGHFRNVAMQFSTCRLFKHLGTVHQIKDLTACVLIHPEKVPLFIPGDSLSRTDIQEMHEFLE
jgi:hypothetical protein